MKKNIHRPAKNGEKQDKEYPGQLIGGLFILVEYVDANYHTERFQENIHIVEGMIRTGDKENEKTQLDKKQKNNKKTPPENDPDPLLFHL